jgi:hypothetical protein
VIIPAALEFINYALRDTKPSLEKICNHCGNEHQALRLTLCVEIRKTAAAYKDLNMIHQTAMQAEKSYHEQTQHASSNPSGRNDGNEEKQHFVSIDYSQTTQALDGRVMDTVSIESSPSVLGTRAVTCRPPIPWNQILESDIKYKPKEKPLQVIG